MPDDELRKKRLTGKDKRHEPLAEAKTMPELAFDPIEAALRQLHENVAGEAIPDDFLRLLDQLDDRTPPE
ncbi:MAG: NepR family anti-sigma factor [Novosphingobium sp.]